MEERDATLPPFDDSRRALAFALNAHDVQMPRPAMNKAMVRGARKAQSKAALRREEKARRLADPGGALADDVAGPDPLAGTRRSGGAQEARQRAREGWLGLEAPAQAGLILREFSKLDREQQVVLTGLLVRALVPCACRRPCCSGWSEVPRWSAAVEATCELLRTTIVTAAAPGKRGLSSQPDLRRAVVRGHYTGQEASLVGLAEQAGVSSITAAKHRALIVEALQRIETEAWLQLDAMFDAAGITGTIAE